MIIDNIMHKDLHTLSPDHTIQDAMKMMKDYRIRHIPIVGESRDLKGILSDRDIKEITPQTNEGNHFMNIPLKEIMTPNPITGHPLDFVEDAAIIFYEQKIGALPIVRNGKLCGMITETDVLYKYIELTGANRPSSQLELRVPDVPGSLYEVSKILFKHKVNVLSVLVYPDYELNNKILAIRINTMNPLPVIDTLKAEGIDVLWPADPRAK
ncbi:acetoin utilization AcuB family protein [Chungangia koreensis]|uniref:Acetoin utilization AcuB family protein n=1 Tax=Chungangia koreensis TaxID=752657 RepID=A0ABV8X667_9LACT